jgi:hypothetical protein
MGLVVRDDGWRTPDWLWARMELLLPAPPVGCQNSGQPRQCDDLRREQDSPLPTIVRTEALRFFSAEEVARARRYHRPLYWAGAADLAIEVSVLATFVWSGMGNVFDPGSLPWWGRAPATVRSWSPSRRRYGRRSRCGVVSSASGAGACRRSACPRGRVIGARPLP